MKHTLLLFFSLIFCSCQLNEKEQLPDDKKQLEEEKVAFQPSAFELFEDFENHSTWYKYGVSESVYHSDSPSAQVTQLYLFPNRKGDNKVWITSLNKVEAFLSEGKLYIKLFERPGTTEKGTVVIVEGNMFKTIASYREDIGLMTPDMNPDEYLPAPHTLFRNPFIIDYRMNAQRLLLNKGCYEVGDTIYGAMFYEGKWDKQGFIDASNNPDYRIIYIKGGFKSIVRDENYIL